MAVISRVLQDLKQLDGFASSSQEFSEELSAVAAVPVETATTTMNVVVASPVVVAGTWSAPKEEEEEEE